jgi:hypothetical protein
MAQLESPPREGFSGLWPAAHSGTAAAITSHVRNGARRGVNRRFSPPGRPSTKNTFAAKDLPMTKADLDSHAWSRVSSCPAHIPGTTDEGNDMGSAHICAPYRTHTRDLARPQSHARVPTLPPTLSRPRRLRDPQEFLWHKTASTTTTYTHVLNRGGGVCPARRPPRVSSFPNAAYTGLSKTPGGNDIMR